MPKEQEPSYQTIKTFVPQSAKQVYDALMFNKTAFDNEEGYLYVLDTNALLQTYSFDTDSFNKLKNFFEGRKVFATHTIETEFIRNREFNGTYRIINVKKNFLKEFESIESSIDKLLHGNIYAMNDNKELFDKLTSLHTEYKKAVADVSKYVKSITEDDVENAKMERFRWIIDNFDFSTCLSNVQYDTLKKEFEELFLKSHPQDGKRIDTNLPNFPGRGEKKKKNEDGDYLVFHELLELANKQKRSVILLTNDVTKDDWVDGNGKTFESYQIMFFAITGCSFKVKKYDDFLKENVKIDPQALLESEKQSLRGKNERLEGKDDFMLKLTYLEDQVYVYMANKGIRTIPHPLRLLAENSRLFEPSFEVRINYIMKCRSFVVLNKSAVYTVDFKKAIMYVCEIIDILPQVLDFIYDNVMIRKGNGSIPNIPVEKCPF